MFFTCFLSFKTVNVAITSSREFRLKFMGFCIKVEDGYVSVCLADSTIEWKLTDIFGILLGMEQSEEENSDQSEDLHAEVMR